jgi:hypothetical protein
MQKKTNLILIFGLLASFVNSSTQVAVQNYPNTINMVLGDISFIEKFDVEPSSFAEENLRITTHLEYVIRLLENKEASG